MASARYTLNIKPDAPEEPPQPMTRRQKWDNFWFYHKWHVIIGVAVALENRLREFLQQEMCIRDSSYTVGILLDKEGNSFDGTGITPDVEIALKADEEANFYSLTVETDPQISKAFEAVTAMVSSQSAQSGAAASSASTPAA